MTWTLVTSPYFGLFSSYYKPKYCSILGLLGLIYIGELRLEFCCFNYLNSSTSSKNQPSVPSTKKTQFLEKTPTPIKIDRLRDAFCKKPERSTTSRTGNTRCSRTHICSHARQPHPRLPSGQSRIFNINREEETLDYLPTNFR